MGKNEYEQLYTPVVAFRRVAKRTKDTYPKNISEESIGKIIINSINLRLPNLKRTVRTQEANNSRHDEDLEL